jgi:hypothetical protein
VPRFEVESKLEFLKLRDAADAVLATLIWSHGVMRERQAPSGYALDERDRSGRYGRYLRGDMPPSIYEVLSQARDFPSTRQRFVHPLFDLLSQPWSVRLEAFLIGLQPYLQCRVRSAAGVNLYAEKPSSPTPRRLLDLTVQGDGYALTALLAYSILGVRNREQEAMLAAKERAWQCLMVCFASGEFYPLTRLLTARIRQRVLDRGPNDFLALDTATPDPVRIVEQLREIAPELTEVVGAKRRKVIRQLLQRQDVVDLLALPRIEYAQVEANTRQLARVMDLDCTPRGRFAYVGRLGSRARKILSDSLLHYWGGSSNAGPPRSYRALSKAWPYRRMLMSATDLSREPNLKMRL